MKENEMKKVSSTVEYKGKEYSLVFNLNVMKEIQDEYGTIDKWGELSDGSKGEPNAQAVIFGFRAMLNEGIDIANEESEEKIEPLTLKQVGRMITEIGLQNSVEQLNDVVIESTKSDEKNA